MRWTMKTMTRFGAVERMASASAVAVTLALLLTEPAHAAEIWLRAATLDLAMPDLGGIETLRQIKRIRPMTEVVMLTGHASVQSAIEGEKLGASDLLIKPCEIDELVEKVERAYLRRLEHEERHRAPGFR